MGSCLGSCGKEEPPHNQRETGGGMQIQGSVVLITGAARGLGRSFTEALLARGAKVCVADVDTATGSATVQELQDQHGADNVIFAHCDVTKDEDFKGAWETTEEKFGKVNLLINNAGIGNEQNWQKTINVNLGGCMRGTLLGLEKLGVNKGGEGGVVVNISSITGLKAAPFGPIYGATKHAIVGLTRNLGSDFHLKVSGVKVQALCPSLVKTDLLVNSIKSAFSTEVAQALSKFAGTLKDMSAETVANALMKLLEEGRNGGCMVVEAEKDPYYVDAPLS
ncbi:15-hydroxyprostaglandin dehydrogenase [NAD(+)]-like isoform X2 [Homarus americanus]|uniref:15-hydroxyprostaglandin dehydrogenase [NAD(+)]-like isoform X2 n=1 Tax=Homarus americanus TaxID=6706 RepID=UPI001C496417|nr:15-hydroxyprostaglandin dehydrogenase [NAD(+)]-like isoform X2 [Homarus americanus]XP_042230225.1 15-hydroxyprostaglandin dehydrogenase [NAD(+)]-like isoform X2 [Homarus americanus]XP_042230226.1 15-hydroxyprostaglandin dehydrogenase [NAD(+)]-like isoform X2 [Homarus americanus]XP_042230228.1 15-hydroxyprostaglandin dehydrogenase [NAD(+)]-like isoform X2 [Homarus americanus]